MNFLLSKTLRAALGPPDLLLNGHGVIWLRPEFDNLRPSHSVVRNDYGYTPAVHVCLRDVAGTVLSLLFTLYFSPRDSNSSEFWLRLKWEVQFKILHIKNS